MPILIILASIFIALIALIIHRADTGFPVLPKKKIRRGIKNDSRRPRIL